MNSGIYYLYEYKYDRRIRTAGFLKLTCTPAETQLQLHARNLSHAQNEPLKLFSFHRNDTGILPEILTELPTVSGTLCAKLSSSKYPFLKSSSLTQTDGFFLVLSDQTLLAAVAEDVVFDTRSILQPHQAHSEYAAAAADKTKDDTNPSLPIDPDAMIAAASKPDDANEAEPPVSEKSGDTDEVQPPSSEEPNDAGEAEISSAPKPNNADEVEISSAPDAHLSSDVRKLHRCDLSGLPRKQWYLANNSFLLHGCHNYGHLILIKKDGHYWLGVPGIYDPREARAAEMFGFPKFTDSYNDQIPRTEDEENPYGTFGYWCRSVFPDAASPLCF